MGPRRLVGLLRTGAAISESVGLAAPPPSASRPGRGLAGEPSYRPLSRLGRRRRLLPRRRQRQQRRRRRLSPCRGHRWRLRRPRSPRRLRRPLRRRRHLSTPCSPHLLLSRLARSLRGHLPLQLRPSQDRRSFPGRHPLRPCHPPCSRHPLRPCHPPCSRHPLRPRRPLQPCCSLRARPRRRSRQRRRVARHRRRPRGFLRAHPRRRFFLRRRDARHRRRPQVSAAGRAWR